MKEWFLFALASALFSAAAAIGQKKVLKEVDALLFSFLLSFFNVLIVSVIISIKGLPLLTTTEVLILFGKTILGAFAFLFVMMSIKNFQLSSVLPILAFTPAFVALVAFVFLNEIPSLFEIIGMGLMILGIYILESGERDLLVPLKEMFTKSKSKYVVYALLLFTISSVVDKLLIGHYKVKPIDFIVLQQIFFFIIFGGMILSIREKRESIKLVSMNIFPLIILISFFTIIYRFLYIFSLKEGEVALALSVKRLSVLFAVIASKKLLGEGNTFRKAVATIFILVGGYIILTI